MWKKSSGLVQRMKALDHSQTPRSLLALLPGFIKGELQFWCRDKAARHLSNSPFASQHLFLVSLWKSLLACRLSGR